MIEPVIVFFEYTIHNFPHHMSLGGPGGSSAASFMQVSEQLQACCKSMAQLFEQGKDFDQDLLGIAVLYSLLQLAQRLEDDTFSETLEDMRSTLSFDFNSTIARRARDCLRHTTTDPGLCRSRDFMPNSGAP